MAQCCVVGIIPAGGEQNCLLLESGGPTGVTPPVQRRYKSMSQPPGKGRHCHMVGDLFFRNWGLDILRIRVLPSNTLDVMATHFPIMITFFPI